MEFVATCPKGFEKLLADELREMRIPQVRPLKGQVAFGGEVKDAYRVCLWSRLASRVLLVLARIDARNADLLYSGASSIDWCEHLAEETTFSVDAHGTNEQLRNSQFVALRTKDAIVDAVARARGARPQTDTEKPDVIVDVRLVKDRATISINLAGDPLFRRYGTRASASVASLRPDYAAMMLASAGWPELCRTSESVTLAALWPGQGSVLVEAAGMALDRAPGYNRTRWGFAKWAGHDAVAWAALMDEAANRTNAAESRALRLIAADTRPGAVQAARQALGAAGIFTKLNQCSVADAIADARSAAAGALVTCDLSWIGEDGLAAEATALSEVSAAAGLSVAVLARDASVDAVMGHAPALVADVMLGKEPATLRTFAASDEISSPATVTVAGREVPVLVPASDQFARRLAKVAKLRAKWARREDVSCYRVYDADLPDYAVAVELYEGSSTPGRWLQVSEYAAPKDIDPDLARRRLLDVLVIAPRVMGVDPANVNLRVRTRARGGSQYADEGSAATPGRDVVAHPERFGGRALRAPKPRAPKMAPGAHLVEEGGLTFEVNFSARLDCGIFLDHRDTRAMIREMAKQTLGSKRFLNLFAYTGTATCYAADGGCKHTTTVDLSRPSLDWAKRNMDRNGFTGPTHEYVQADVLAWVTEQRHTANRWDLIFCDVPTFSNSARMRKASFDVQRDHAELIIGVSRLLTRNGQAVFSCNLRTFKPDYEKLERASVQLTDITAQTIPEDFARNPKIHHCYLVKRV